MGAKGGKGGWESAVFGGNVPQVGQIVIYLHRKIT